MKKTILLLAMLLPLAGSAQTLQEYLAAGLERNYGVRIVRNIQRIAENNVTLGNAGFLPTVDLSASHSGVLDNSSRTSAGINVGWTVFNGFSVQTTYERLREVEQMGELNTRLQVESFISRFVAGYYSYIRQRIRLRNIEQAVGLSEERMRIVETGYEIGTMSRLDLQQAVVDLNSDRSKLIRQYEVVHTLRTQLNEMMVREQIDAPLAVADTAIVFDPALDRAELWQRAVADNVFLKISRKEGDISRLDLRLVQSRTYPYLRLGAGYGYTGLTTFARVNAPDFNYGLTLGMTLFNGHNQRRQERNARIEIDNRQLQYEQTELALRTDLENAWMAYRNNMSLIELERANLAAAREYYDIAIYRYKLQQLSGIELREAQNSLLDAEERMAQALHDTKLCEISLLQIAGRVIEYLE
ncbi:MAG: TolC family protein [Rikenellaceae bacterium]|nr:TolC family protein [Rikenellaceae bacterium]MCL2693195.1 TolC family protein [Rikenellaceae bacterium]